MNPSNEPAQLTPRLWNICLPNSGNPAAKAERKKVFAAIAEAALFRVLEVVRLRQLEAGSLQHEISVYEIIEGLEENGDEADSDGNTG